MPPSSDIVAPVGAEHNTLYVAIEISRKSWMVGIKSPASERIGLHSLGAADVVGLKDLIEHQQTKAERALGREVRVLCCYEAGYEGFWLARWLDRTMSVETVVLDPASLLVNRKAKQRKTDRIDARKMVRALLAHDRGDAAVLSRVRIREKFRRIVLGQQLEQMAVGVAEIHPATAAPTVDLTIRGLARSAAGVWVLDVAQPVPDQAPDIEFVVDEPGAALRVTATHRQHFNATEILS